MPAGGPSSSRSSCPTCDRQDPVRGRACPWRWCWVSSRWPSSSSTTTWTGWSSATDRPGQLQYNSVAASLALLVLGFLLLFAHLIRRNPAQAGVRRRSHDGVKPTTPWGPRELDGRVWGGQARQPLPRVRLLQGAGRARPALEPGEFMCCSVLRLRQDHRAAQPRPGSSSPMPSRSSWAAPTPHPDEKRDLGMVFQYYSLFPHLTVAPERGLRTPDPQVGTTRPSAGAGHRDARSRTGSRLVRRAATPTSSPVESSSASLSPGRSRWSHVCCCSTSR